jgi:Tfp pilus assembly protein PilN
MKRINLLPPEIAKQRRVRQQTGLLVIGFAALIVILIGVWFLQHQQLTKEQDNLASAEARVATLQTKVNALQQFAQLDTTVKQKEQTLATAMTGDVAWSRLLIELSMMIPGDSWITSFSGTAAPPTPQRGAAAAQAATKLGNVNFSAVTFDFPGVAKWLTRMSELKSLQTIWVPSAAKGAIGSRQVINYSSTADLSKDAASNRYQVSK